MHLAGIADDEIHLVAAAMSLVPSIGIDGPFGRDRSPTSEKAKLGLFTDPFCAFVAQWTFKVHELSLLSRPEKNPSDCYDLLGLCISLQTAVLSSNWLALAAISTSAHHVSDLSLLNASHNADGLPFDWTESLGPWLESAHAKRLRLSSFAGLFANHLPLNYLTHLGLLACRDPILGDMAALLEPAVIESIRFQSYCLEEMTGFVMTLPLFPRLAVVDITGVSLGGHSAAPLSTTKTLRVVLFRAISWSANALATLLDWMARADVLECSKWTGSEMVGANCDLVGRALRCWIATGALRCCSIADDGLKLDLSVNSFGCDGLQVLLDALAPSSNIVVLT
ncbi:hypothetical protein SDRG_05745 [Saprolegnia diclina VS20]|uniref:F-box domain-containing protein n=1 Tax=Saprolegnia diclina (strain VS20) TaxID=1156394 RepID=T0RWN1_SAPDV|nr:hypothetical protein SDRG_05745 [Saprolegnia diclina VS20]EQC36918.1 hypothetical protein SDRG_05745 [Saprolegnia diclina VS20]|eukprot:XP_008609699.1 hypothetical protein SDRG_05745 [Saprolegnia diclina VS20]